MNVIVTFALVLVVTGCATDNARTPAPIPSAPSQNSEPMERAVIVGSAENPDPVLTRVRELEERGLVKDVVVRESFPAQIQLTAPRSIIDELNRIPRVGRLR
jgi:hypothetical protein